MRATTLSVAAAGALTAAAVVLGVGAPPAVAAQQLTYPDVRYDANGLNDQLEGSGSVSTPGSSDARADLTRVSVTTRYALRDSRRVPVATVLRATMLGTPDRTRTEVGYEMRGISFRCGSFSGVFYAGITTINDECDKGRSRVPHPVSVTTSGRDLVITVPYTLNKRYGFLAPGDVLGSLQINSVRRSDAPLRLDWANAPFHSRFTVGR